MKRLFALMTVLPLIVAAGCGNPMEHEALRRAKDFYNLTRLSGSYYLCEITQATGASKTLYELRNIQFVVSPRTLSEAEKLNGIEWQGWVHLYADAFRSYCPEPELRSKPNTTWSAWFSPKDHSVLGIPMYVDAVMLTKAKDGWEIRPASQSPESMHTPRSPDFIYKRVAPSDLPR